MTSASLTGLLVLSLLAQSSAPAQRDEEKKPGQRRIMKSERDWQKVLTREQFMVTRMRATEPAFSGRYVNNHARGTYTCVCCGADLFSSKAKFNSGTGWPSFWRPIDPQQIVNRPDLSESEPRMEVNCRDCGAHLGHVFNDGPPPTGLRYCVNSVALKFVPDKPAAAAKPAPKKKAKTPAKKSAGKSGKTKDAEPAPAPADPPQPEADSAK